MTSHPPYVKQLKRIYATLPLMGWIFIVWTIVSLVLLITVSSLRDNTKPGRSYDGESEGYDDTAKAYDFTDENGEACNVVGINLHGGLTTYVPSWWQTDQSISAEERNIVSSEYITAVIDEAADNENIKAILIDVDSPGGSPVAGEEIASAITHAQKRVVGLVRGVGASAAYWAISSAQPIFASRNSDVGGIGVTASYAEKIDKDATFVQLSTGKYKDAGNPDKPITDEEKQLFMRDVQLVHENFIKDVAHNRRLSTDLVRDLADGSTMLGEKAKELGLIDLIGNYYDALDFLKNDVGTEDIRLCWY